MIRCKVLHDPEFAHMVRILAIKKYHFPGSIFELYNLVIDFKVSYLVKGNTGKD